VVGEQVVGGGGGGGRGAATPPPTTCSLHSLVSAGYTIYSMNAFKDKVSANKKSKNLFLRLFPIPKLLEMPSIGLDISDQSVRFLELVPEEGGFTIGRFGDRALPEGVVVSGEIIKTEVLRGVLGDLQKEFGLHFVRLSLPEEKVYLFKTSVLRGTLDEMRNNIEFQLEDNVPLSPAEVIFDFDPIRLEESKSTNIDVSVSVMPETIIRSYAETIEASGLVPLSFEIEAQAIARAVVPFGDLGTYMIVDFGKTRSGISIKSEGVIRYTSTLDIGGNSLVTALQKAFKVSEQEAEKIKIEKGLGKKYENKEVFETLLSSIAVLRDEISRHYIYWHNSRDKEGREPEHIVKVILCGGDSNLVGLIDYLSSSLRIPVEMANVWTNVLTFDKNIPQITFAESLRYATTIGLALRRT
jgi:type IV pilus assembly protein PilM